MPEVHFEVRWPSGRTRRYCSPSAIVHEHLKAGTSYDLQDFLARTETAMNAAGSEDSAALDTLAQIQETGEAEEDAKAQPNMRVIVLSMK